MTCGELTDNACADYTVRTSPANTPIWSWTDGPEDAGNERRVYCFGCRAELGFAEDGSPTARRMIPADETMEETRARLRESTMVSRVVEARV